MPDDQLNSIPADEPRTDRELLLEVNRSVKDLCKQLNGENGVFNQIQDHESRIKVLENWKFYVIGIASLGLIILGFCGQHFSISWL